jgi:hypothetical protein
MLAAVPEAIGYSLVELLFGAPPRIREGVKPLGAKVAVIFYLLQDCATKADN